MREKKAISSFVRLSRQKVDGRMKNRKATATLIVTTRRDASSASYTTNERFKRSKANIGLNEAEEKKSNGRFCGASSRRF